MSLVRLTLKNAARSPIRSGLTALAVAISLTAFVLLRAVNAGWTEQVDQTPNDRVVTRHKMGWGRNMPVHYVEAVRVTPGVAVALGASWGGLRYPNDPRVQIEGLAVDAEEFVAMHSELEAPAVQKQAFVADRRGAFISQELADELGWRLDDYLSFESRAFAGTIELTVAGIFRSRRHGFARRSIYFHWDYFNEKLPEHLRDRVNMIAARVADPAQGARVAQLIDAKFSQHENQTYSQEDQAVNAQLVGRFGALLEALDVVSFLILGVVMLILGNTISMGVGERRREYGTLRALGFQPPQVAAFVIGESAALGLVGGVVCLVLAYPLVERVIGAMLTEKMNFPAIHVPSEAALMTLLLGGLLGAIAAAIPAWRVARSQIIESLRSIG